MLALAVSPLDGGAGPIARIGSPRNSRPVANAVPADRKRSCRADIECPVVTRYQALSRQLAKLPDPQEAPGRRGGGAAPDSSPRVPLSPPVRALNRFDRIATALAKLEPPPSPCRRGPAALKTPRTT